jgi:predicted TIM-barrel fold metal-dependent hydrolase
MVEHHLDRYGLDYALLNPGSPLALAGHPFLDQAAAIASATNDWTINEWFPVDERFLGSILVSPRDPELAAQEIRRLGAHPRMVQVTMTAAPVLMGERFMHPIYEAANEFGLVVNLHVGGGQGGINPGDYPVGHGSTFFETHIGMCIPGIYHLISMVAQGVFEKFPKIKFVMNEFGIVWLPFVMWRMDMEYRAARDDVPWLTRLPSSYIKEFVRFSTQPLETPEDPKDLVAILTVIGAENMLVFASDYPHWDFDNPDFALKGFPADWRERILFENARKLYRLDERLGLQAPAATHA